MSGNHLLNASVSSLLTILISIFSLSAQTAQNPLHISKDEAVEQALKNNHTLKSLEHQLNQTEYGVKSALTGFLPKVSVSGTYARLGIETETAKTTVLPPTEFDAGDQYVLSSIMSNLSATPGKNSYSADVTVQQPIFNGFATINALQSAKISRSIQQKSNEKTGEKIRYAVLQVYLGLVNLKKSLNVTKEATKQLEEISSNQEARLSQGMSTEYDYLQVKASLAQAKVNELNVYKSISSNKRQFAVLLGLPPSTDFIFTDTIGSQNIAPINTDSLLESALISRPDIKELSLNLDLAKSGTRSVKSSLYPSVNAGFNYSFDFPDQKYRDQWGNSWNAYLSINFNILDWGNRNFKIKKSLEMEYSLLELLQEKKLNVEKEIIDAHYNVYQLQESVNAVMLLVGAKEKAYNASKAKYDEGTISMYDLLDSYNSLISAKYQVLQTKMNLELSIINLNMGGLGQSN